MATTAADERSSTAVTGMVMDARPRGLEKLAGTIPVVVVTQIEYTHVCMCMCVRYAACQLFAVSQAPG